MSCKNGLHHFYPSTKDRREKINELQAMIFDEESASDAQKFLAPPKRRILEKKADTKVFEKKIKIAKIFCGASKNEMLGIVWNVFTQNLAAVRAMFER